MLTLVIPEREEFDESTGEFIYTKEKTLQLEHSLVSISKWEAKWQKPFLDKKDKTHEEIIDYVKCMTINQNIDQEVYNSLRVSDINKIKEYIDRPMTATTINHRDKVTSRQIVTSELIYYWMVSMNIPFECQKWHLNRLLILIDICNIKSSPEKKMSAREVMSRNSALNKARRAAMNSKG